MTLMTNESADIKLMNTKLENEESLIANLLSYVMPS